ncbi:MAG: GNAT family N-acetyltransferase [Desulfobacteraceae bacterium]|nr:GNAT family N-acetyltransferase [Desulfobacteraceae bacterium]MBC2753932.1 GNAT family N-acetyltransferase [Desulfobacteraceae bacterium]
MHRWQIRHWDEADSDQILSLINLVQPHMPFSKEKWRWAYTDHPDGPFAAWVCEEKNRIVGFYGLARYRWYIQGKEADCLMPVDAMTHPDYRMQGMHDAMVKVAMKHILESQVPLAYVFPNEKSTRSLLNHQWQMIFQIPLLKKSIGEQESFVNHDKINVKEIFSFDERFDDLDASLKESLPLRLARDRHYLTWRYLDNQSQTYRIFVAGDEKYLHGYMIFKVYQHADEEVRAHIVDFFARPDSENEANALIRKAILLSAEENVNELSCWMLPHVPLCQNFNRFGFKHQEIDRFLFVHPTASELNRDQEDITQNWYLTMGDSDIY